MGTCFNSNEKEHLSVKKEENVLVVEHVGSSQGESVTQVAGAGEREFCPNPRDVWLRSCRELKKSLGWRIRSQSVLKLHALLPIWVYSRLSFAETLSRPGQNFPCLKNVPLLC